MEDTETENPQNSLVEIVETRSGQMLVLTTDSVIGMRLREQGDYASEEKDLLEKLINPGDAVIDVGANIGNHTLFFARQVGSRGVVFAFEAQRILFQLLCGNVALNSHLHVHCLPNAVGDHIGEIEVPVPNYNKPNNFGGYSLDFQTFKEPGYMVTLDAMNFGQCDLIKVDVEGMEKDVLVGAAATISTHKPTLYVENNRPDKAEGLLGFIANELSYKIYKHGQNVVCVHEHSENCNIVSQELKEIVPG